MSFISGRQNQTGRIGSTTLTIKPEFTDCFSNKVIAKNNQQRLLLDHVHTRTSSPHQSISASISAHTQMKLCRLGEGKHAVRVLREEGCLPLRSHRSCASTTATHVADGGCSSTCCISVCVCVWRLLQSRLRREWQGSCVRHHHYPIPSARGEA